MTRTSLKKFVIEELYLFLLAMLQIDMLTKFEASFVSVQKVFDGIQRCYPVITHELTIHCEVRSGSQRSEPIQPSKLYVKVLQYNAIQPSQCTFLASAIVFERGKFSQKLIFPHYLMSIFRVKEFH